MKKLLLLLPIVLLTSCVPEPTPAPSTSTGTSTIETNSYQAVLNPTTSGLISYDQGVDTSEELSPKLPIEGQDFTYDVAIGSPCYYSSKHKEMIMKNGAYFKSTSTYVVEKLIVDFYAGQGINFNVYAGQDASGEALPYYASSVAPEVSGSDGGTVYEYFINGTSWYMNNTSTNKDGFYSVTIVFSI